MSFDTKVRSNHHGGPYEGSIDGVRSKSTQGEPQFLKGLSNQNSSATSKDLFSRHLMKNHQHSARDQQKTLQQKNAKNTQESLSSLKGQTSKNEGSQNLARRNPSSEPSSELSKKDMPKLEKGSINSKEDLSKSSETNRNDTENQPISSNRTSTSSSTKSSKDKVENTKQKTLKDDESPNKFLKEDKIKSETTKNGELDSQPETSPKREPQSPQITKVNEASTELKSAVKTMKMDVENLPVISLLTGRLEQLEPSSIVNLVAFNQFIQGALNEDQVGIFFQKEMDLGTFLRDLEVPEHSIGELQSSGANLSMMGSPFLFLKAMGIDAQQVKAEIEILKDNLSLGSIDGYLVRARKLAKALPHPLQMPPGDEPSLMAHKNQGQVVRGQANSENLLNDSISEDILRPRPIGTPQGESGITQSFAVTTQKPMENNVEMKEDSFKYPTETLAAPASNLQYSLPLASPLVQVPLESKRDGLDLSKNFNPNEGLGDRAKSLSISSFGSNTLNIDRLVGSEHGEVKRPIGSDFSDRVQVGQKATYDHWFELGKFNQREEIRLPREGGLGQQWLPDEKVNLDFPRLSLEELHRDMSFQEYGSQRGSKESENLSSRETSEVDIFSNQGHLAKLGSPSMLGKVEGINNEFKPIRDMGSEVLSKLELTQFPQQPQDSPDVGIEFSFPESNMDFLGEKLNSADGLGIINLGGGLPQESMGRREQSGFFSQETSHVGKTEISTQERALLAQKIFDSAQILATQGGGQIQLNMPETPWGKLNISVQMVENQLNIRVAGVDDSLKDSLAAEFSALPGLLESRKIEVGKIEFLRPVTMANTIQSQENFRESGRQNLDDHQAYRELMNDLRSQFKLSNRALNNNYKLT